MGAAFVKRGRAGGRRPGSGSGARSGSGRSPKSGGGDDGDDDDEDAHDAKAAAHAGSVDPADSEVFELKLDGQEPAQDAAPDAGEGDDGKPDEQEAEENTSAVRRRRGGGGKSSGRARRGGGSAGGDDDRAQIEAEKKKVQTVLMVAIPVGLLFLLILAVVVGSGGETRHEDEGDAVEQSTVQIKDVPESVLKQVKSLLDEGSEEFKAAERSEGTFKIAKLESANRKLSEAEDVANAQRSKVPDANRGANFDQLDQYEQQVAKTRYMVRKALLEAGGSGSK